MASAPPASSGASCRSSRRETSTAVVNTGDDDRFHGLLVCPDLDSVTYTLAGAQNPDTGWGLVDETFHTMDAIERYGAPTWFRLGDRDLATHLFRTQRVAAGATLSEATTRITDAWDLPRRLLPMTDDRIATRITAQMPGEAGARGPATTELAMQEWFVRERCEPPVVRVHFDGADRAAPAPGVLDALHDAETILVLPEQPGDLDRSDPRRPRHPRRARRAP